MKRLFTAILLTCSLFGAFGQAGGGGGTVPPVVPPVVVPPVVVPPVVVPPAPTGDPSCLPASVADMRDGVVDNNHWYYWYCRDETHVWLSWTAHLGSSLKASVFEGSQLYTKFTNTNDLISWSPVDTPEYAKLKDAVLAAAAVDTNVPAPGPAFVSTYVVPELWNVTPNGAIATRKTNLYSGGKVLPTYGATVKVLAPCDCSALSIAEGTMTKKCPLAGRTLPSITEVISCIRLR